MKRRSVDRLTPIAVAAPGHRPAAGDQPRRGMQEHWRRRLPAEALPLQPARALRRGVAPGQAPSPPGAKARTTNREFVSRVSFTYLGRSFRLSVRSGEEQEVRFELARGASPARPARRRPAARRRRSFLAVVSRARRGASPEASAVLHREARAGAPAGAGEALGELHGEGRGAIELAHSPDPEALVDYRVAHEAVHLEHRNHATAFWAELRSSCSTQTCGGRSWPGAGRHGSRGIQHRTPSTQCARSDAIARRVPWRAPAAAFPCSYRGPDRE
jgi:hypothetical protein